jgi:diguanylate cyclase
MDKVHGQGLHSIRWRFALASTVLTIVGVLLRETWMGHDDGYTAGGLASLALLTMAIGSITFCMATQLTNSIESLRRSTEAIAAGALDSPVAVDCACEVGGLASSFRKMTQRMNANLLRINALAYTDPVTGLPNRSAIDHLLGHALAPESTAQAPGGFQAAILFIGLGGFKHVNDRLGHQGGDALLQQAATRILERGFDRTLQTLQPCTDNFGSPCARLPDDLVLARFTGDEFVAILPGVTDRIALRALGERLVAHFQEPFRIGTHDVVVQARVGIALTPQDTSSATELLTFADLAMHCAKRDQRAPIVFFDQRIRDALIERTETESALRLALQRNELRLHFQPKVDADTLHLAGVEALVRWQHPQRGLLLPGAFIEVAEQAGLMGALGQRVIDLAVAQCRIWLASGRPRQIAVNVSPSQFASPEFVPHLLETLRCAGVPNHLLSIEITESIAMSATDEVEDRLKALHDAGIRIAIDDFGVGFSNLSQLARVPMHDLKIDRSLVMAIGENRKSEVIIRATIGMAHALGYRTIAEGIETPQQQHYLTSLGCDILQGYRFGRPMDAEALDAWVAGRVDHITARGAAATTPATAPHPQRPETPAARTRAAPAASGHPAPSSRSTSR